MRTTLYTMISILVLTGCGAESPPAIRVGEVSFTTDELLGISPERRRTLAYLTAFGLAAADSTTRELGSPLVEEWLEDRRLEILAAELTVEGAGVEDAALESHYLTDPEWDLTVRHILFFSERWRSPAHREEALAKARRAREQLRSGADFARTAAELSEEPGAEGRQGLLEPGREGAWVSEFWAAALALEPGEISPVTETQYGYHILRLEDRETVPFDEARSSVVRSVAGQIGDSEEVLEAWLDERGLTGSEERRREALAEAERRNLEIPDAERLEIERRWEDQTYRWSAALGFRYGWTPDQVRAAALEALALPGQNAGIVRGEIDRHGELFQRRYEIEIDPGTD